MLNLKKYLAHFLVLALVLPLLGCQNVTPEETVDIAASMQAEKDRVEQEKAEKKQQLYYQIADIINSTLAVDGWALTIGEAITGTFHNYSWDFKPFNGSDTVYLVTFSGNDTPNPRDFPTMSRQGSITWKVDVSTGQVSLYDDPNNISSAFILLAIP